MFNAINSFYLFLGGNSFAILVMALAVMVMTMIIGYFIDRLVKPSLTKSVITTAVMSAIWLVMFAAIGKPLNAVLFISLQVVALLCEIQALKITADFRAAMATLSEDYVAA